MLEAFFLFFLQFLIHNRYLCHHIFLFIYKNGYGYAEYYST